jgi:subtilisin family serine protease
MDLRIGWRAIYGILFDVGLVDMGFAAQALHYAADKGARIASCSWGRTIRAASESNRLLSASGGLIFKAAGNDSTETADYLCARNDVLCVAATDQNDCKASFSTYGNWVDISAPGVGIWSSWHNPDDPVPDYISTMDGTSMATPLSASVAALIWSQNPTWTATQVRQRLFDSADPIDSLLAISPGGKLGAGRINAFKAGNRVPPLRRLPISASPTFGCPLVVNFSDLSAGSITHGHGISADTAQRYESSTRMNSRNIYVSLTVSGNWSDAETKTVTSP